MSVLLRRSRCLYLALLLGAVSLGACAPQEEGADARAAEDTASAMEAQADAGADADTIRELERRWVDMVASGDTMGIAELHAEDARLLPPNAPGVEGRDAIRSTWAAFVQLPLLTWEPDVIEVSEAGDMAYTIGTYRLHMPGEGGAVVEDRGKYVDIWEKRDGEWKVVADIFNSDLPPGGGS